MNTHYETPDVEVVEIEVEKGFATSGGTERLGEQKGSWGSPSPSSVWDNL